MYKDLLIYLLRNYNRSYRFIPPLFTYLIFIGMFYTYKPNPVMGSFAVTSVLSFIVTAWICYSFMQSESPVQEEITLLHLRNPAKYYIGLLIAIVLMSLILLIVAMAYPIVGDYFDRPVGSEDILVGLLSHLGLSFLGIAIAVFFTGKFVSRPSVSIGGILIVITLSFCQGAISSQLSPSLEWLTWILPPTFHSMNLLMNYERYSGAEIVWLLMVPFIYSFIILTIYIQCMRRK
ncbi:hypothetical protein [Paenibacillus glacialis]|uniref:Uncharacterized protein n=1 Tax=Paenibacillus glacialis TaxID=494026 RepID=A0A168F9M3_9BACL|nr:hypothetical protein [Paenibacillus glacialis]OAB35988.1 hypothetical protein PGLA_21420 [Paenibacillus glacialis]